MAFKSLGERLGFVSAGDVRRARERQIRKESEKRGEKRGKIIGESIGEKRGREQERAKADAEKLAAAREMLRMSMSKEDVCRILKLSSEQVARLRNS